MPQKNAYDSGIHYLSRREYSAKELKSKLTVNYSGIEIDEAISKLQTQRFQSDERFAEAYTRFRSQKGFGAIRIKHELEQKGVAENLIKLELAKINFTEIATQELKKKFPNQVENLKDKAKRIRFMLYRGFSFDDFKV